jgi:hypothetical protein
MRDNIAYFTDSIYNVSTIYDEDSEEYKIIENNFFNLYCYTEYFKKLYKMNMTEHYLDILKDNGFVITEEGEPKTLDPEKKAEITELTAEIKEQLFQEFLIDENKKNIKYDSFNKHIEFLKIPLMNEQETINTELLNTYKNEITDKHALQDHVNIIRLLKDDDYINEKMDRAKNNSYDIKNMSMIYSKIKAIRNLEAKYNIKVLEVDYKNEGAIDMADTEYRYIKSIFRITKKKPECYEELKKMYVTMLKNVATNDLIKTVKSMKTETRNQRFYNINNEYIQFHLKLNNFSNIYNRNFHEEIKENGE